LSEWKIPGSTKVLVEFVKLKDEMTKAGQLEEPSSTGIEIKE
jgi:hypothetical protein